MAACAAVQEAVHLRRLLDDLGFQQDQPTKIYEDNQGCIAMSNNPVMLKRTKHIDVRYHFIREKVENGDVVLKYIPTEDQLADAAFTKANGIAGYSNVPKARMATRCPAGFAAAAWRRTSPLPQGMGFRSKGTATPAPAPRG